MSDGLTNWAYPVVPVATAPPGSVSGGGADPVTTTTNDGVYSSLEAGAAKSLGEAAVGIAIFAGILVAITSTRFYPLAYAIVGLAALYVLLEGGGGNALKKLVDQATAWTGGKPA